MSYNVPTYVPGSDPLWWVAGEEEAMGWTGQDLWIVNVLHQSSE